MRKLVSRGMWALFVVAMGACGGNGCDGCAMGPLPAGGVPSDQTLEGGAQIRVTAGGFTKLTALIPAAINDAVGGGFTIPENQVVNAGVAEASVCVGGCPTTVTLEDVSLVPDAQTLNVRVTFDAHADVPIDYEVFWLVSGSCDANLDIDGGHVDADISFAIDPATGELRLGFDEINSIDLTGISVSGNCGGLQSIVDAALNLAASLLDSFVGDFIIDALTPVLEDLVQNLLPDPLGVAGTADLSNLLATVSPGTRGALEMRLVPGGFVEMVAGGLTLGVITGLNADDDPSTRTAGLASEPAACVPSFVAPDFAAAPASLGKSSRQTFQLLAADEFRGSPEPDKDLVIGASESFLDLAGHHAVTSGALCLELGTELIPQLNLGAVGIIVPSLSQLGAAEGRDPLLLVTRPTRVIDFEIGDGTEASPSLTLHMADFEIDFYAFLFERYVRGFTVSLDLDVGINLEFTTDAEGNAALMPILIGLEADQIGVEILNAEFLREDAAALEQVFPALLDLVLPLIAGQLDAFALPEFAGFRLDDLSVDRVTTSEDDFLAIGARLASSTAMMTGLGERYPSVADTLLEMAPITPAARAEASARLVRVDTPLPATIRAGLAGRPDGALPKITLELAERDQSGRTLEWTWNLGGGMWRPFQPGGTVVLRDRAFAIQGRYDIELRPRVVGDYRTLAAEPTVLEVVIDSVGPRIVTDRATRAGDLLSIPVFDLVSAPENIELAFAGAGAERPETGWSRDSITVDEAASLATAGAITVFARDELGNESRAPLELATLGVGAARGCSTGGGAGTGAALLLFAGLLALARRSRLRLARIAPLVALLATPACSCGSDPGLEPMTCELADDCAGECEADQVPMCLDGVCLCLDDVPHGRIGQYSSMAAAADGTTWVAGYNSTHGDLMIAERRESGRIPIEAWEFVAGVPDGPVVIEGSEIRGGINAGGPDVGLYTDVVAMADSTPIVSYFDRETGSLSVAMKDGDAWHTHVVDPGAIDSATVVGQYSSLSLTSDGRPGVAYFARAEAGGEIRTEVRYAEASSAAPRSAADWSVATVAEAAVPADEDDTDPLVVPYGIGLFVELVRRSDDSPVILYHDRIAGQLVMATADGAGGYTTEILDGGARDVGWYPSAVVDDSDTVHVSYVDFTSHDLLYLNTTDREPVLVDDGYRVAGTTADGLPKPELHFIGDDSAVVLTSAGPVIVYQDATSHELLTARLDGAGVWGHTVLAGDEDPFAGAYGFYADADSDGSGIVISTWVIDQARNEVWVELFRTESGIE